MEEMITRTHGSEYYREVTRLQNDSKRIWDWKKQIWGNLAPFLAGLPFFTAGIFVFHAKHQLLGPGLFVFALGVIVAGVSLNWLAMISSRTLEMQFQIWHPESMNRLPKDRWFVGYSQPGYAALLDPHQDVGYFFISDDRLGFIGEIFDIHIAREDIESVSTAINPHSLIGLGGFIAIHGKSDGKPIELRIEQRNKSTLFQNKRESRSLLNQIQLWANQRNK